MFVDLLSTVWAALCNLVGSVWYVCSALLDLLCDYGKPMLDQHLQPQLSWLVEPTRGSWSLCFYAQDPTIIWYCRLLLAVLVVAWYIYRGARWFLAIYLKVANTHGIMLYVHSDCFVMMGLCVLEWQDLTSIPKNLTGAIKKI